MIKCYDIATLVTNEATEQFGSSVHEDPLKKARLQSFCNTLDDAISRFGGTSMKVEVDDVTMDITITAIFDTFEVDDPRDSFHDLFRRSKRVTIQPDEDSDDMIQIAFLMDGIWNASVR